MTYVILKGGVSLVCLTDGGSKVSWTVIQALMMKLNNTNTRAALFPTIETKRLHCTTFQGQLRRSVRFYQRLERSKQTELQAKEKEMGSNF